jgi:hypothetical protein
MGERKRAPLTEDEKRLRAWRRRANKARNFPENTCGASRHLHIIAEQLSRGRPYPSLEEDPKWCAETMLVVLACLWEARTKIAKLEAARDD